MVNSIDGCVILFLEFGFSIKSADINMFASTARNPSMINNIMRGGPTCVLITVILSLYYLSLRQMSSILVYSYNNAGQSNSFSFRAS